MSETNNNDISYNSNISDNAIGVANTTNSTENISENYENIGINSDFLKAQNIAQIDYLIFTICKIILNFI